jgi:luciferase family oxidoreductase group 1
MRLGLFCPYAVADGDFAAAMAHQVALVRHAEALGYDSAWVVEHHFAADSAAASIAVLLGHLAAATSRIRLGTAAVLLPFHDPLLVAEDIATIDCLSGGRVNFGVARGGPFAEQNRNFAVSHDDSRERMLDALDLIHKLLTQEEVTHHGPCYRVDKVRLAPRPVQQPVPIWIASGSPDSMAMAVDKGFGFMAGPPHSFEKIDSQFAAYRAQSPDGDAKLVMARYFHAADTREEAMAAVTRQLSGFIGKMKPKFESLWPEIAVGLDLDALIERSVIGSHEEVREKMAHFAERFSPHTLALLPMGADLADQQRCLASLRDKGDLPPGIALAAQA